ncbi:hypothetical protein OIU84_028953 [Salix udensis]|uniref:Aldose 1-epimerase n=1 Tax=Salix udensis TaxID=889485 RepID=A0AAD6KDS3_9ROSI|nr:hypothetical protein OIU84_028953 [Salix udensis]
MAKLCVSWCFSLLQIFGFLAIGCSGREEIGIYELKQGNLSVKLTNYGAHIISLVVPDKHGKLGDVVLGYDTIEEYKVRFEFICSSSFFCFWFNERT